MADESLVCHSYSIIYFNKTLHMKMGNMRTAEEPDL